MLMMILFTFGTSTSCSFMEKKRLTKAPVANREVASISPYRQRKERPAQTKTEFFQMLKNGSTVVSHVVYFENKKPVCYMPADPRLVPDFAKPQRHNRGFSSKMAFKKGFPKCGRQQWDFVASAKNNFVPEGTQLAVAPAAVGLGVSAIVGCLIATLDGDIMDQDVSNSGTTITLTGILAGGISGVIDETAFLNKLNASKAANLHRYAFAGGANALLGVASAYISYLLCGTVAYIAEAEGL